MGLRGTIVQERTGRTRHRRLVRGTSQTTCFAKLPESVPAQMVPQGNPGLTTNSSHSLPLAENQQIPKKQLIGRSNKKRICNKNIIIQCLT